MAKKNAAPTKSEIYAHISKETELSKKQLAEVFESLNSILKKSLRSCGVFTLPGLLKLKVVKNSVHTFVLEIYSSDNVKPAHCPGGLSLFCSHYKCFTIFP